MNNPTGDFQVWKSGGVIVDYQSEDPERAIIASSGGTPGASAATGGRRTPHVFSPRSASSGTGDAWPASDQPDSSGGGGGGGEAEDGGGAVVTVKVVFAPHQLMHSRACVDQVRCDVQVCRSPEGWASCIAEPALAR